MKKDSEGIAGYSYLLFFVLAIIVVCLISILVKTIFLFKDSKFTSNNFTVLVYEKNLLVHVDTLDKKITSIYFTGKQKPFTSKVAAEFDVGIPFDAVLRIPKDTLINSDILSYSNIIHMTTSFPSTSYIGLNVMDVWKIYWYKNFSHFTEDRVEVKRIDGRIEDSDINKVGEILKDSTIFNDKVAVEIVNSSGIDGLGAKVASLIKLIGVSVVSVTSKPETNNSMFSSQQNNNYTQDVLERKLELNSTQINETGIADISIILGKDFEKKIK